MTPEKIFLIELIKALTPLLTVILTASLATLFYFKNKQVDYSLKLSEKALIEVYDRILSELEARGEDAVGLSYDDLTNIEEKFLEHNYLVHPDLFERIKAVKQEYKDLSYQRRRNPNLPIVSNDRYILDQDEKLVKRIKQVRELHLKKIGYKYK